MCCKFIYPFLDCTFSLTMLYQIFETVPLLSCILMHYSLHGINRLKRLKEKSVCLPVLASTNVGI